MNEYWTGFQHRLIDQATYGIWMYGVVGLDFYVNNVLAAIASVPQQVRQVNFYFHSDGGYVDEGLGILTNILRLREDYLVKTFNDGQVASMTALLFLAGQEREMAATSRLMIHRSSLLVDMYGTYGKEDIDRLIEKLEAQKGQIDRDSDVFATLLAAATGMSEQEVMSKWLDGKDHYFSPQQAVDQGIATSVGEIPVFEDFNPPQGSFQEGTFGARAAFLGSAEAARRITLAQNSRIAKLGDHTKPQPNKPKSMKRVALAYGLNEEASEDAVLAAKQKQDKELEDLRTQAKKDEKTIETLTEGKTTADARIAKLEKEARVARIAGMIDEIKGTVLAKDTHKGMTFPSNAIDETMEAVALDLVAAKEGTDEKLIARHTAVLELMVEKALVPVGDDERLKNDAQTRTTGAEGMEARLKAAKEEGEQARKASEKRLAKS